MISPSAQLSQETPEAKTAAAQTALESREAPAVSKKTNRKCKSEEKGKNTKSKSYQQWDARIVMLFVATGMDEIVMCDENKTDRPLSHYKWHKCFDTRTIPSCSTCYGKCCSGSSGIESTFKFSDIFSRKLQKCKDACEYVDDLLDMRRALREINGRMDDSELVRIVVCDVHMVYLIYQQHRHEQGPPCAGDQRSYWYVQEH
ncbi:hypothetical protein GN244_ATG08186 [Phytophthora infestans]|uniref:Uncharacterized protein n=1 Tax=Phytophthora infestans TaxID=4787 RepID=A0A833SSI5_PHYIN|nr:hypothetical protein GN244_ATG08186 [Phytophthora infestans]